MRFPKITAGLPETYNRKYRRALGAIARTALTGKQRFARVSALIGAPPQRARKADHNRLVIEFVGEMGE